MEDICERWTGATRQTFTPQSRMAPTTIHACVVRRCASGSLHYVFEVVYRTALFVVLTALRSKRARTSHATSRATFRAT